MFFRPTLQRLQERIENDLSSRLLDGQSFLSRSVLKVLSTVYAGACHLQYSFFEWGHKQAFPDTANKVYLERWASIWGVKRKPGSKAKGKVRGKGTTTSHIKKDTVLRSKMGDFYLVLEDSYPDKQGAYFFDVLSQDLGQALNLELGEVLQFVSPVIGVENSFTSQKISGAADVEDDDSLRQRLLLIMRKPPMGGNKSDYEKWALEVPGVTRAWALPLWLGVGTIGLSFVCDDTGDGIEGDIIPTAEMVKRVQDYVDLVRPLSAALIVFAPAKKPVDIDIIVTPYNEALALRIKLELKDLFIRESGLGQILPLSHIREAVSITTGEHDHTVISPTNNLIPEAHELLVLGEVIVRGASA